MQSKEEFTEVSKYISFAKNDCNEVIVFASKKVSVQNQCQQ